jgi:hypothetical protein
MVSRTVLWLWLLAGFLLVTGSTADTQPISLTLSILAYNRPASLQRLLKSLIQADYDTVGLPEEGLNVNIFLDAAKEGTCRQVLVYILFTVSSFFNGCTRRHCAYVLLSSLLFSTYTQIHHMHQARGVARRITSC